MKKHVIVTHFTMKIICMYLYITCNKKILFVLYCSCCFLNTNTVITQQLIQTARTLEAELWQVCG